MAPDYNRLKSKYSVDKLVARCSPANRDRLARHVEVDRTNFRETSIASWVVSVLKADAILAGKDFATLNPDDCLAVASGMRAMYSKGALRLRLVCFRKHLRWVFDVDDLEKSEALGKRGRAMEEALWVRREKEAVVGQVMQPVDFAAFLAAVPDRIAGTLNVNLGVQHRAAWRCLRQSGHRITEHTTMNLRGTRRQVVDGQPCYRLELDPQAPGLKTGARTIYIAEPGAVAALDDWLAIHPHRGNPDAPLWVDEHGARMTCRAWRRILTATMKAAGLLTSLPAPWTPHDFRHTCATEKAELGWGEYQMCTYFGWEIGSKTPGTYVHMSLQKQQERIMADARRAAAAAIGGSPESRDAVNALVGLLKQAVGQMGQPAGVA